MEWVSVKTRLPNPSDKEILLYGSPTCGNCDDTKRVISGRYCPRYGGKLGFEFGEYCCTIEVTHWTEMPEPPKEE